MDSFLKTLGNSILNVFLDQSSGPLWDLSRGARPNLAPIQSKIKDSGLKVALFLVSKSGAISSPIEVASIQMLHCTQDPNNDDFKDILQQLLDNPKNLKTKLSSIERFFLCAAMTSEYSNFHALKASDDLIRIRKKFFLEYKMIPLTKIDMQKANSQFQANQSTFSQKVESSAERIQVSLTLFDNLKNLTETVLKQELMQEEGTQGNRQRINSEGGCARLAPPEQSLNHFIEMKVSLKKQKAPFQVVTDLIDRKLSGKDSKEEDDDQIELELNSRREIRDELILFTDPNSSFSAKKYSDRIDRPLESSEMTLELTKELPDTNELYSIVKKLKKNFIHDSKVAREKENTKEGRKKVFAVFLSE